MTYDELMFEIIQTIKNVESGIPAENVEEGKLGDKNLNISPFVYIYDFPIGFKVYQDGKIDRMELGIVLFVSGRRYTTLRENKANTLESCISIIKALSLNDEISPIFDAKPLQPDEITSRLVCYRIIFKTEFEL